LKNSFFLPFAIPAHRYDKEWFSDGRVAIIMIGKFLPRKRHDLLLDALSRLPDPNAFRVTFVGELSSVTGHETLALLRERIRHLKFEVDIRINMPLQEVMTLYRKHDLFVLPSQNESASVSNLEAMSFGLPTVVSDCNQTGDYGGPSGWVFRSGSARDLSSILEVAVSNRNELKRRGALAWDVVEFAFSPDGVYGPFFDRLLSRRCVTEERG
jgi:glycosyltransferase involved in cell wall biosynthesis